MEDITGDPKTQAEGKAKQAKAKVRHPVEEVKDAIKDTIDQSVISLLNLTLTTDY